MEWITTSTLLDRMKADDQTVWGKFCERFRQPLLAFARRFGLSDAEADDALQDILTAFVEAYRAGKYDREKGRLSSWLFGIAYRQIANRRRERAVQQGKRDPRGDQTSFWGKVPDEAEAEQRWDADWENAVLEACLRQVRSEVSENTYAAFERTVRLGRTPDEAAAELGMTRNAVYVAKHRVLKRLEELMQEYENPQG
jgi:RNA polymerase sigma-70 factor (ECF subfamily)